MVIATVAHYLVYLLNFNALHGRCQAAGCSHEVAQITTRATANRTTKNTMTIHN